jgi:hypothetical protein
VPQTHPGPLRVADWDELAFGTYQASQWAAAPTAELQGLLQLFNDELVKVTGPLQQDAEAFMIVEDWQTDLKKVTLRVVWTNPDGSPYEFSQSVYLHRDSEYTGD